MAGDSRASGRVRVAPGRARLDAPDARPAARQRAGRRRPDPLLDPDAPSWLHDVCIALCVLLVLAALVALAFHEPGAIRLRKADGAPPAAGQPARPPIVEALGETLAAPSAAAPARSQDTLAGGLMRAADVIAAGARAACFGLDPEGDVCLGPAARLRVGPLGQGIELLAGRAVVSVERLGFGVSLIVKLGELRVEARDAALGLELDEQDAVVRVLRGVALVSSGGRADTLMNAHSALYRASTGTHEVMPQPPEKARRDWELLAVRSSRN